MAEKIAKSKKLAAELIYEACKILKDNNGEMASKDVVEKVGESLELDDWAKTRYPKSGYIRWQSILHFYTIDLVKAGFLIKKKGIWYLTPEGENTLRLGKFGLFEAASEAYKKWERENKKDMVEIGDEESIENEDTITLGEIEQQSFESLKKFISTLNAYEFQDLVAALLRGMGYYTPFVAPKGKDGGIDVIAYRDPLGIESPRIKCQVKHRESPVSVQEIRELMGILQKDGDVGIFISTGGFTSDAYKEAHGAKVHVELINYEKFISLWQDFYFKLNDEDKSLMPLKPIYFLAD